MKTLKNTIIYLSTCLFILITFPFWIYLDIIEKDPDKELDEFMNEF